jgi:hypothetical protein
MTSFRHIEANRRNARKSTGPATEAGKDRSRRNAVRHGLTAETVIVPCEDEEDYSLFEAAVTADFNPETAVERELVLRLASLLWRLRRAGAIETGLFKTATGIVAGDEQAAQSTRDAPRDARPHLRASRPATDPNPMLDGPASHHAPFADCSEPDRTETSLEIETDALPHLATRFLHLAAVDKGAFERLGRYETALWRQVCQTVFMLDVLRRQGLDSKWLPRSSRPDGRKSFSLSVFSRR